MKKKKIMIKKKSRSKRRAPVVVPVLGGFLIIEIKFVPTEIL